MSKIRHVCLNVPENILFDLQMLAGANKTTIGDEIRSALCNHTTTNRDKIRPQVIEYQERLKEFLTCATEDNPPILAEVVEMPRRDSDK